MNAVILFLKDGVRPGNNKLVEEKKAIEFPKKPRE